MELLDVVTFKNKQGHVLYGRICGITKKCIVVMLYGFRGRYAIRRVRHTHKIAKVVLVPPVEYMIHQNHYAPLIAEQSRKAMKDKRRAYRERMRRYKEKQEYYPTPEIEYYPTRLDAADRLAREATA